VFLNRFDRQVKIRGNRIELGEIEMALRESPGVSEAVVVAQKEHLGGKRLVAYVVTLEGLELTTRSFRRILSEKLPEYMIPSVFVSLSALPLTPNGKIDRQSLPAPPPSNSEVEMNYAAPRTPIEETLTEIWAEALELERVGIHDNFFELGGHSLLMVQIASRIHDHFNIELPLASFLRGPTVAQLAVAVTEGQAADRDEDDISQLLDELENLSLEEIESSFEKQMKRH
jgi:surfactin family lipopeptide synthetase C